MFNNKFNRKNDKNASACITYETHCRYCGKDAVYYEKEHGSGRTSKVFFEELGGVWPKHFCKAFWNTEKAEVYIYGRGSMNIYWVKRGYDSWYKLNDVSADIVSSRYEGVYIVWYFDVRGIARTVKVREGSIGTSLEAVQADAEVQRYAGRTLYATWALVGRDFRESVSVSLNQKLQPFVGERSSDRYSSVTVGLPSKIRWHD